MLFVLAMLSLSAQAAQSGKTLEHKDWEVVCDNTLTCRIAGYAKEEDPSGSILLTRAAGPGTETVGEVTLGDTEDDSAPAQKLTLWIDGKSAGDLVAARAGSTQKGAHFKKFFAEVTVSGDFCQPGLM